MTFDKIGDIVNAKKYYLEQINNFRLSSKEFNFVSERLSLMLILNKDKTTVKFIKDAIKKNPNSGNLWVLLAFAELNDKNHKEALEAAEIAKKLQPNEDNRTLYNLIYNRAPVILNKPQSQF